MSARLAHRPRADAVGRAVRLALLGAGNGADRRRADAVTVAVLPTAADARTRDMAALAGAGIPGGATT